ncbi:hypothetical protein [Candidatus Palauibacter soopunensis]|uniref:hypothetical protein n=1 Tax=Candidatus Palauibacter soopunensis TaxID=3056739 RepID=UPI002393BCBC|nr:hypothetical protein [Candidatus Palauibacter soopunensis]MDE2879642.1 hypothetical protein [Candidatus Palauibacter soopunensis]
MPRLRVDPWDPEYGSSVELEELTPASVELDVETDRWETMAPEAAVALPCCVFVDGVRRIDLRLYAEDADLVAPALAGSWAVGAAWAAEPPSIDQVEVGRALVVGDGLHHPDLVASIGGQSLRYPCRSVDGRAPVDPIHGLQNQMREAEANLASRIFGSGEAELLILDGPLTYLSVAGPVVGLIKRQSRAYLPPERSHILGRLASGTRTPLFGIGDQQLTRYSWYVRIASGRPIDGVMTGIVRLEVSAESDIEEAIRLADLTASILPRFASRIGRDPRAPQNLYPVGRLESVLRHRLGDPLLLRRSLEVAVWREGGPAT